MGPPAHYRASPRPYSNAFPSVPNAPPTICAASPTLPNDRLLCSKDTGQFSNAKTTIFPQRECMILITLICMFLSEWIITIASARIAFFRLLMQPCDEIHRVYPIEPPGFYRIGDSPYSVPSGTYTICFYSEQHQPMPHTDQLLPIDLQGDMHRANQSQLSLHRSGASAPELPPLGVGAVARPVWNAPD